MSEPGTGEIGNLATTVERRAVNVRSVLLGLLGVVFICGLTPYNDYVVGNTYLVGNFLPVGLLLFFMAFIIVVNAPLRKWAPNWSLDAGEMSVAMGMTLVSCALPSSGLMRYLPGFLVGMHAKAAGGGDPLAVLQGLHLPDWIFPTFQSHDIRERGNEPVVQYFMTRIPIGAEAGTWGRMMAAWITPAIAWGILLGAMFGAVLCMMVIVRRQWVENERLAFPLATVYLSLIETPERGRAFNALFRSKLFWIAFGAVFFIHGMNALHVYDQLTWPEIPIRYTLYDVFGDPPWFYLEWAAKTATIYFSIVGITYFLQTKVAFSLWGTYILYNIVLMVLGARQAEMTQGMKEDQLLGAIIPFTAVILWVGRHHWAMILKQMVRGPRGEESPGRYLPYFVAGWGMLACMAAMAAWLVAAGTTVMGAVFLVAAVMVMFLILARIVAETGLIFVQIPLPIHRPWILAAQSLPASMAWKTTLQTYFFGTFFHGAFIHDMRESLSPFALHAFKVADVAAYERTHTWRKAMPFTLALVLALGVGYIVAGGSMLATEYAYGATLDKQQDSPINGYGVNGAVNWQVLGPTRAYQVGDGPIQNHSHWLHVGVGGAITTLLSVLRLRYVNWPLHPIGFMLVYSYPMMTIWFSIFLGWMLKVLIVRFGGSTMFRNARPFFIGLIVGEAGAAAFWLMLSLARVAMGLEYHRITLLPG